MNAQSYDPASILLQAALRGGLQSF